MFRLGKGGVTKVAMTPPFVPRICVALVYDVKAHVFVGVRVTWSVGVVLFCTVHGVA